VPENHKKDQGVITRADGSVRAVERALALLEAMGDEARGIGLSDLARKVGVPISTVHR
jgi:IclR family acetate operon transcriptional repressor